MMARKQAEELSYGIIGLGRFGSALASTLAEAGKEIMVLDCNEEKVRQIRNFTEHAYVVKDLQKETLRETGIQNCDVVAVCIGEQIDASILITMSVLELGVPKVISKAMSPEQGAVLRKIGAEVVYPEKDMAIRLGKRLISNNFLDYIMLDNSVEIRQILVPNKLCGETIMNSSFRKKYGLNIIAIQKGHNTMIEISPDYQFEPEDVIVVIGKIENINRLEQEM